jgi:hypothetical protein
LNYHNNIFNKGGQDEIDLFFTWSCVFLDSLDIRVNRIPVGNTGNCFCTIGINEIPWRLCRVSGCNMMLLLQKIITGGVVMKIESIKPWVNRLGIKKTIELDEILDARKKRLTEQLTNTLPDELKEKFGYWDATSNIVWCGGCAFTIFTDVGLQIDNIKKEEYYEKARDILQPVVKAWSRFGIVLTEVSFLSANDGVIKAHFTLR